MASLVTNSLAMLAARLLVPFFSFGINVAVARMLGSHVLGQYVELVALLLVAQALAGGGLSLLVTRDVAAHPDGRAELVRRANRVGLGSGILATALFLLYAQLVLPAGVQRAALLLALSILPSAWISTQEGLFMGLHLHPRITGVALVEGVVKLLAAAVVLYAGWGLEGLCAGLTLGRLVALVLGQRFASRAGAERPQARPAEGVLELGRALVPFAAIVTLGILYFRQDVLVVGALRSESETGLYGVASTLYALTLLAPNSVMAAIYPRLSASFALERDDYHEATVLTSKLLAVGGAVMAIALIAVAPWLVHALYGEAFLAAVPVLSLLAAVLPLHGVNAALGQAMQAAHLQNEMFGLTAATVAVNLALLFLLVPSRGIEGAAFALLVSSGLAALALGWIYHRRVKAVPVGPRGVLGVLAIGVPVGLALGSPAPFRLPGALLGLLVLAGGARLSGLLGSRDLARLGTGLGLGARGADA